MPFIALSIMRAMIMFYDFLFMSNLSQESYVGEIVWFGVIAITAIGVGEALSDDDLWS